MGQLRCKECNQLLFKYRIKGNRLEIEIKCYNCNAYNYFTVWLNKISKYINTGSKGEMKMSSGDNKKIVFKNITLEHKDNNKK